MMEAPANPFDIKSHTFVTPQRCIKLMNDMQAWERSQGHSALIDFITTLNRSISGKSLTANCHMSEETEKLVALLDSLSALIKECPPVEQPQRFGNKAFRTWFQCLKDNTESYLLKAIPENFHRAIPEIRIYFEESFGNSTRIDYGTGHETAFVIFLYCLFKIGLLKSTDKEAIVCVVFNRYLDLVRELQKVYRMEPAGSHGVWSLDDYQFVPFIWGSAQLIGHGVVEPHKFLDENILDKYGKDFMFLSCILYILQVKTGPFAEHSNQLWCISAVPSWSKVNQGLIKMYTKEVLGKFPVVQHMLFGSLFTMEPATNANKLVI